RAVEQKGVFCMVNATVKHVVKHSFLYSYALSQPFLMNVEAYPALQNQQLLDSYRMQHGEQGETVRMLQKKLNKLEYYDDEIDGKFGILTEHAVKKFQSSRNIKVTGKANMETMKQLIKEEKQQYLDQIKKLSGSIYPGLHSEDVKIVQQSLYYFGYYEANIDGIYGPLTKKALELAEEEHGIELTNRVTKQSLTSLYEANDEKEKEKALNTTVKETKIEAAEKEVKQASVSGVGNQSGIIQEARAYIGTPYVWGGESPGGFDCSGYIHFVYKQQNRTIPRTVSDIWNFATPVDTPSVGDLVFFQTYKKGPSHMGIYLGNGTFIHAGESRGVEVSNMNNSYWKTRYIGAKRIQ
ncbi:C40 family peptidase, partial [Virgibacillus sp. W0430]|uniref:C40 family peptidase n=1 Tax=Virgibacillus sp. W0430 TaxID=3391580 RepID=UPI003F4605B7